MRYPEVYAFDDEKEGEEGESKSNSNTNEDEKPSIGTNSSIEDDVVKIEKAEEIVYDSQNTDTIAIDDSSKKTG